MKIFAIWQPGETININLLPEIDLCDVLKSRQTTQPNMQLKSLLGEYLPKRLVLALLELLCDFLKTGV